MTTDGVPNSDPMASSETKIQHFLHRVRSSMIAVLHYDHETRDLAIWYW
jgi:hypothetical protein